MSEQYLTFSLDALRKHGHNQVNDYTDSHLALSLSLALSGRVATACGRVPAERAAGQVAANLRSLLQELTSDREMAEKRHPFLALHRVRALDAALWSPEVVIEPALRERAERVVDELAAPATGYAAMIEQLGMRHAASPGFDPSALLSACCLHVRLSGDIDAPIVRQAVEVLVADQNDRGSWASAALLSLGKRRFIYLPSIETSAVLAQLALLDVSAGNLELFEAALPALDATFQSIRSSWARHGKADGWRNDRNGAALEVETWTTAVVLEFLLDLRELLAAARQEMVLRRYKAVRPQRPRRRDDLMWIDVERLVGSPARNAEAEARIEEFEQLIDPTRHNVIVNGIAREVLRPALSDLHGRPVQTASFLLYGPPGTRKTTMVETMAETLDWPLVTLSPPKFLGGGIEGFEASADTVFEDLGLLRRVVVLFDECEEFFRARPDGVTTESRTVGAFITAGMLPRLQRLRDIGRVVFVINSNVEAHELDGAVTRRGRLDRAMRYAHPTVEAQERYLRAWPRGAAALGEEQLDWLLRRLRAHDRRIAQPRKNIEDKIKETQKGHPLRGAEYRDEMRALNERMAREVGQPVTWTTLDRLAARLLPGADRPITDPQSLKKNFEQELKRFGPDRFPDPRPA